MSADRDTRILPDLRGRTWRSLADWWHDFVQLFRGLADRWIGNEPDHIRLDMSARNVSACVVSAGKTETLGSAERDRPEEMASLARVVRERMESIDGRGDIALCFSQDLVFRLPLELPRAGTNALQKAAFLELERLSPIPAASLYVDVRFSPADGGRKTHADIRAVRRSIVDETVALCRSWGLSAAAFLFEGDRQKAGWRVFPVDRPALVRTHWRKHGTVTLAALALTLLFALILAFYARLAIQAGSLVAQAEAESEQAAVVHRLEHDIATLRTQYDFATAQKSAPLAIAILDELSRTLPDNAWLTRVDLKGDTVHIEGFSKSPSDVIAAIDQSPAFANAQFGAPPEGAQEGAERFDLTFDVKRKPRR